MPHTPPITFKRPRLLAGAGYGPKTARKALWLYAYVRARAQQRRQKGPSSGNFWDLAFLGD